MSTTVPTSTPSNKNNTSLPLSAEEKSIPERTSHQLSVSVASSTSSSLTASTDAKGTGPLERSTVAPVLPVAAAVGNPLPGNSIRKCSQTNGGTAPAKSAGSGEDGTQLARCTDPSAAPICVLVIFIIVLLVCLLTLKLNQSSSEKWHDHGFEKDEEDDYAYQTVITSSLNISVKPCSDFYAYACDGWIADNPIPADEDIMSSFTVAGLNTELSLHLLLTQNSSAESQSGRAKSVVTAQALYQECMDQSNKVDESRDGLGHKPISDKLNQLIDSSLGTWPILEVASTTALTPSELEVVISRFLIYTSIIDFTIMDDAKAPDRKLIHLLPPDMGMGEVEYLNPEENKESLTIYLRYVRKIMALFSSQNVGKVKKAATELLNFESKLAHARTSNEILRDSSEWYHKYTLADFSRAFMKDEFNWTTFFNRYTEPMRLSYRFTPSDEIIVLDVRYYQKLPAILAATPAATLYNYLGWSFVRKTITYADSSLTREASRMQKEALGLEDDKPSMKRCLEVVKTTLDMALARLYIDERIPTDTKEKAEQMIDQLQKAFGQMLEQAKWLDADTKMKAREKLAKLRRFVAFPSWLPNNEKLDEMLGFGEGKSVKVVKGQYFQTISDIQLLTVANFWEGLKKTRVIEEAWATMTPIDVNAEYGALINGIYLPAAILQPPFFDVNRPAYLNLAAIGTVIGHELTHGFDDQGREFDSTGKMVPWWSEATTTSFDKATKCFEEQYGAIKDSQTGKTLNGLVTLSENTADNGAIRCAHSAFEDMVKKKEVPPAFDNFTSEQLFFIAFAQVWCNNRRLASRREQVDYDVHVPEQYRVNVPLANFEAFSAAFNCPPGSPMNGEKKCRLW